MNLRVAQAQKYVDEDWWEWSVWIEGQPQDLDEIKSVTYKLHSTFPNPVRTRNNRADNFKLESAGWGTFTIRIKIELKSGDPIKLDHHLELLFPDGTATDN